MLINHDIPCNRNAFSKPLNVIVQKSSVRFDCLFAQGTLNVIDYLVPPYVSMHWSNFSIYFHVVVCSTHALFLV